MKRVLRILLRLTALLAMALLAFYIIFYFAQHPMVYESERDVTRTPADLDWEYEDVSVPVDGNTTTGWFIPFENARGTILFCHGNGSNVGGHLDAVRRFREMQYSVLIFDYGGFGRSTGSSNEARVYADAAAMWTYLTEQRKIPANTIVIWGSSFGGAAACDLGSKVKPAALVLESTFTSMADAAFSNYPYFPADWFLRSHFRSIDKIARADAPVLIMHSIDDTQYPIAHGRALFGRAHEPKRFIEMRGDHYDSVPSKSLYNPEVLEFLGGVGL